MADLRKYGVETRIYFPLYGLGTGNLIAGVTIAAGDAKISKDAGAFANVVGESDDDLFVDEGSGLYSLKLAVAELQCAAAVIRIVDQTNPKEWEDIMSYVETYGNASAQHAFDLDTASVAQTADNETRLAAIETDTGTTLPEVLVEMQGASFDSATDSLKSIRDRGDAAWGAGVGNARIED